MAGIEVDGVRYSRPEPPEWADLVGFVQAELDGEKPLVESALALANHLETTLDNEALATNLYQVIGLVACGVARGLYEPDARAEIVKHVGESLFQQSLERSADSRGVIPDDVTSAATMFPFAGLVHDATATLSPEIRLLSNGLVYTRNRRELLAEYPDPTWVENLYPINKVIENDLIGGMVAHSITAGTTGVFRVALRERYLYLVSKGKMQRPTDLMESPTVADILQHGGIEPLSLQSIGHHAASLREDEFLVGHNRGKYTATNAEGCVIFRRDQLPHKKMLTPPTATAQDIGHTLLHTKRYGCPALYVEGMIRMMLDIIPEAVEIADRKILSLAEWPEPT